MNNNQGQWDVQNSKELMGKIHVGYTYSPVCLRMWLCHMVSVSFTDCTELQWGCTQNGTHGRDPDTQSSVVFSKWSKSSTDYFKCSVACQEGWTHTAGLARRRGQAYIWEKVH